MIENNERVTFKCPSNLARAAERAAAEEMLSTSAWIRRLVAERLRELQVEINSNVA
jgi:hypothetical protein